MDARDKLGQGAPKAARGVREARMEEHLVAFADLLGFGSIIKSADEARQEQVLRLLKSLSVATGNFEAGTEQLDAGREQHWIRPAISAFSDNMVFSFPAISSKDFGAGAIALYLANSIGRIFSQAIGFGCLVRGGVALGPLYHEDGMVFGAALVEAYELESRFARRPRVIISEGAARWLGQNPYLFGDEDGFCCLDYLKAARDEVWRSAQGLPSTAEATRKWIASVRAYSQSQIELLSEAGNVAGLQNWRWFAARFERFVRSMHPSVGGDGPEVELGERR
jgi:hypothetical protein